MKHTIQYQKSSILRRIGCIFFDGIIALSFFVLIVSFIINPIIGGTDKYKQKYQEYTTLALATHLYDVDSNNSVISIKDDYDTKLKQFYNDNCLGYTIADYNELKKNAKTKIENFEFVYFVDDGQGNYIDNVYNDEAKDSRVSNLRIVFYQNLVNELQSQEVKGRKDSSGKIIAINKDFEAVSLYLSNLVILSWIISLVVSTLLTYLMFPMIFKDRTTLGKKMFNLVVVNSKTGQIATRFQAFSRFIFFALIGVALGVFSYGITIIISIIIVIVTPKHMALHDVLANTLVVSNSFISEANESNTISFVYDDGKEDEYVDDLNIASYSDEERVYSNDDIELIDKKTNSSDEKEEK